MSLRTPPQDKLRDLESDWLAAERAVLEHPEIPECMRETARKAVERLEEAKCQDGQQKTLPLTISD